MITQVRIFESSGPVPCGTEVNDFLKTLEPDQLIEIKYEVSRSYNHVMVIYKRDEAKYQKSKAMSKYGR